MTIDVGRIFCNYGLVDGSPASGTVWVAPVNMVDDGQTVIVLAKISLPVVEGVLDEEVVFDNADITPDLYLQIEERLDGAGRPPAYIVLPTGGDLNLATATRYEVGDINPIPEPGQGPPGPPGEDGEDGEDGAPGTPGAAATIAVGTTTTGAAGSNASVANAGSSSAAILNFTIPRGNQGIQGIQGIQGVPGEDGVDGEEGEQGEAGPAGAQGPEGPEGPEGPQGEPGAQGTQGIQGIPGTPGADGEDGVPGSPGSTGATGAAGADGLDTNFLWVDVVTGSEARPGIDRVMWVGGTEQPVNMEIGDIWMKESS